jgi:hypothetical protein
MAVYDSLGSACVSRLSFLLPRGTWLRLWHELGTLSSAQPTISAYLFEDGLYCEGLCSGLSNNLWSGHHNFFLDLV